MECLSSLLTGTKRFQVKYDILTNPYNNYVLLQFPKVPAGAGDVAHSTGAVLTH